MDNSRQVILVRGDGSNPTTFTVAVAEGILKDRNNISHKDGKPLWYVERNCGWKFTIKDGLRFKSSKRQDSISKEQ